MNNLINDVRSCFPNNISVSVKILCRSNIHINVRLEVSHKQKLSKVAGYKYILHFLYKYVVSLPKKFKC